MAYNSMSDAQLEKALLDPHVTLKQKNIYRHVLENRHHHTDPPDRTDPVTDTVTALPPPKRMKPLRLPPLAQICANLSEIVYHKNPSQRASYWNITLTYVMGLSSADHHVWHDRGLNHVYIAFRGTANANDILTDIALVLGIEKATQRFARSLRAVREAMARFKPQKVIVCGHSLGGSLVLDLCPYLSKNHLCFLFNAGITAGNIGHLPETEDYYIRGDPVSILGQQVRKKRILSKRSGLNVHTILQFTEKL